MSRRRALRRAAALAASAAVLGLVSRTADLDAARSALLSSRSLVSGALELELGRSAARGLGGWAELVVDQSPALAGEKAAVLAWQQEQADERAAQAVRAEQTPQTQSPAGEASGQTEEQGPFPKAEAVPAKAASDAGAVSEGTPDAHQQTGQTKGRRKVSAGDLEVQNETEGQKSQVKKYWRRDPALKLAPASEGPQILILHTHATEAYTMADGDDYQESDPNRTTDESFNVIRVGEEMKKTFEEMGLSVVHDKSTYDYPGYSGSYARSLAGARAYLEQYPTIRVILDVHRDAIVDKKGRSVAKTADIDGESCAQVMLVVGTNDSGLEHPDWRSNYTLALKLQAAMLEQDPGLPRPIDLRSQRFNQHLTCGSVLVEVGTSGNTLRQALAGARRFARAAGGVYLGCVEGE